MTTKSVRISPLLILSLLLFGCGGYEAADPDDLVPRDGEIVGVLIDSKGKSHPDATVQLYRPTDKEPVSSVTGIDSDGRFGLFPSDSGTYTIVGIMGTTDKGIRQNIEYVAGEGMSIGTVQGTGVSILTVHVAVPEGFEPEDIEIDLLGYQASGKTIEEGVGILEESIPAGTFDVQFSKSGLEVLTLEDVEFIAGEAKLIDDIEMTASSQ